MIGKIWGVMRRPSTRWGLGTLVLGGAFVGALGWNGFHYAVEATTSTQFCLSCHSMRGNFEEYKTTVHYSNPMGVRAECADCHVPKTGWRLYRAKVLAAKDLWGEITGSIDTPEKFEAHRLEMAETVWADMKANDSMGCRSCHSFEAMDFAHQTKPGAATRMQQAMKDGGTCIDCHKGIAHKKPDMSSGYKKIFNDVVTAAGTGPQPGAAIAMRSTALFATRPEGAPPAKGDGEIMPLAPVEVLSRDGDWVELRVDGWVQDRVERLIVAAMGRRAIEAVISAAMVPSLSQTEPQIDPDTNLKWSRASVTVWAKAADFTTDAEGLAAYGSELAVATCSACHTAHPAEHFGANQWPGVIKDMKSNTTLDAEQVRFLQTYLQLGAKDMPHDKP